VPSCNNQVACQYQLDPATDRYPIDSRDDWFVATDEGQNPGKST
jgi:hypothetical protein